MDRTDDKEEVLKFLKELRKYYLTDCKELYRNNVTFIVNIQPEFNLLKNQDTKNKNYCGNPNHKIYPKLFDYILNLKKINIDNYDVIIDGLLKEKKVAIERLGLKVHDCNNVRNIQGLQWIIKGKDLDIREIKERLNAAFSLYESILDKFGKDKIDSQMTFEKCAVVSFLTNAYPEDFNTMGDRVFQKLVEQYISGKLSTDEDYKNILPDVSPEYIKEVKLLIENKHIDTNYRVYFYNYPKGSEVLNAAEIKVMNAIIYREDIEEGVEDFVNIVVKDDSDVIYKSLEKVKESRLHFPDIVFKSEPLYIEAMRSFSKELLSTISGFKYSDEEMPKTLLLFQQILSYDNDRKYYNKSIAEHLCTIWKQKCSQESLLNIRKMLCKDFPKDIEWYISLFMSPHPLIREEELNEINDITTSIKLVDQDQISESIVKVIHEKVIGAEKEDIPNECIEAFYINANGIIGEIYMVPLLLEYMLKINKIIDSFESIVVKHIHQDEKYVKDYVQLVNEVAANTLSKKTLSNLHKNNLFEGLNEDVRNQQYQQGFYLDYIYSMYYTDIGQIDFTDEHLKNAIEKNSEEIFNDNKDIWLSIRAHILSEYQKTIGSYKFMFRGIYPLITEQELSVIETVNLSIDSIDPNSVVEDNIDMIANYFNRKQRLLSETYKILMFTASLNNELCSSLFYKLDMKIVPYKRIAKDKKKQIKELFWDEFGFGTPQGALRFMEYVEELDSDLEQIIKPMINEIKEVQESYANLVRILDNPSLVTIEIINKMDEVYAYGEKTRNILYENKNYKAYILSSVLYSGTFEIEEDKKSILWGDCIDIFKMENEYEEIKSKMAENKDFLHKIMKSKSYIEMPENSRIKLAIIFQDADCLDDVILYGNEFAELYYSKIAGFESKHAAEKFIEIISKNNILLKSQSIYDNTYQLLIDPTLKSKYTRMRNKQIEK